MTVDPRTELDRDITVGQVYVDDRSGDETTIVFVDSERILSRDEDGHHRLVPRKQFESAVGAGRYKLDRNEDGTYAKGGKLRKLRRYLDELESTDGRKASHKAEAVEQAIELLTEDETADLVEVPFEEIAGIGASTASNLRNAGYTTERDIVRASDEELLEVSGVGTKNLSNIRDFVES